MIAGTLPCALEALGGAGAITFIDSHGRDQVIPYAALRQRAVHLLGHLQRAGVQPGDELVICLSNPLGFVDVLWACLFGGIIPVPLAVGNAREHRHKVLRVLATLVRPVLFTERAHLGRLESYAAESGMDIGVAQGRLLLIEDVAATGGPGEVRAAGPDDLALIQFSSGSTGDPKGVPLTHRKILATIGAIRDGGRLTQADSTLSWMPLTHDMGLIGLHLLPIVLGMSHAIMPPELFARRPVVWLEKASALRATVLASPNFGYAHLLKALSRAGGGVFDLSCVRLIFNGAEPISPALCDAFSRALAPHGLAANTTFPAYGLAEAALAVAFPRPGEPLQVHGVDRGSLSVGDPLVARPAGAAGGLALVSVGAPVACCGVRVAGAGDAPLAAGHVGHVQIRGETVMEAYYGDTRPDRDGFTKDGWFDTGDLGAFVDADNLVIVGRAKDTIIVMGQNLHAHDLERLCDGIEALGPGKVVCVGARDPDGGAEMLIAFVQYRGPLADFLPLADQVARAIGAAAALDVRHVVPVASFPRTTSGKVQRFALRDGFEAGAYDALVADLRVLRQSAGRDPFTLTETEQFLKEVCALALDDFTFGVDDDIIDYGADSLALASILAAIDERFPGVLQVEDLLDASTITAVAAFIDARVAAAATTGA